MGQKHPIWHQKETNSSQVQFTAEWTAGIGFFRSEISLGHGNARVDIIIGFCPRGPETAARRNAFAKKGGRRWSAAWHMSRESEDRRIAGRRGAAWMIRFSARIFFGQTCQAPNWDREKEGSEAQRISVRTPFGIRKDSVVFDSNIPIVLWFLLARGAKPGYSSNRFTII